MQTQTIYPRVCSFRHQAIKVWEIKDSLLTSQKKPFILCSKEFVVVPLFQPRYADQGISMFPGDTRVKLSASGIKRDTLSLLASSVGWEGCAWTISISSAMRGWTWSIIISRGYMQCIIISIYQLVLFSEGKVHSLLRFRWRINRSVLDCITDIAASSRHLHTVWGWLRPSALNPAKRDSFIPVLFTEGGNPLGSSDLTFALLLIPHPVSTL